MKLFGLELSIKKRQQLSPLYGYDSTNLWTSLFSSLATTVTEPFTGAWQRNIRLEIPTLLSFSPVYCCVTGIASDIAKMRIKLTENNAGIWEEITSNSPWLKPLSKPNHYQTRYKFSEQWALSKLLSGNTYVLKERDARGVVRAMYILDPCRVTPLIADNGDIYYQLKQDTLNQVFGDDGIIVPASEIMHDSMPGIFNPLVGTSPLYACMNSVAMGTSIQSNSQSFFANRSLPGGMLTAPGRIAQETADRMKALFETNFSGSNTGKLFVAGDGLKFEPLTMTAEQALLVEQLKWSVSDVARAFHYPEFKLGGPLPPYSGNMQALILSYYTDCLQSLIESMEATLDDGLEIPINQGTELDTDNLLRMDTASLYESNSKAVGGGWLSPDEARLRANYAPKPGGDTPYLQQQMWSLKQLSERTSAPDGASTNVPDAPPSLPRAIMSEQEIEDQITNGLRREVGLVA